MPYYVAQTRTGRPISHTELVVSHITKEKKKLKK